ncbi:MAG: sigma-70 family RNA polymerase sigma factor [Verrucomicrobiota bacterium]
MKLTMATRRSLLTRLKDWEDHAGWQEFFDTYWKLIYSFALKSGLSEAEAQDVVQETVLSVAKRMKDFKYDPAIGSFKSWLLTITRSRIADHYRKQSRQVRRAESGSATSTTRRTATIERIADPAQDRFEAEWDREWHKHLLEAATERIRRKVNPKQFQIFDCYVLKQWSVGDVARTLGVSVSQVYVVKHRIGALIQNELQRLEEKML